MNFAITGVLAVFVIVPEVFGADLEGTGARKKMLPVEEHYAYNLKVMWDFEGILRYSPIFYGYYSEKEKGAYLNYVRDLGKFSSTPINDRQLLSQKIRQKISAIITNTNPPLQTLLFSRQNVN